MNDLQNDRPLFSPERDPLERAVNPPSGITTRSEYLRLTKTFTYSYLLVLPLILLYEIGIRLVNAGQVQQIRIGADVLIKQILGFVGIDGTLWFSIAVLAVGGGILWYERKHNIELRPRYFLYMSLESAVYGITIGMIVASVVASIFSITWPPTLQIAGESSLMQGLVLSLGAGIYEELVFRLILVSLLVGLLSLARIKGRSQYVIAAVIGALIFSAVHYIGDLGDPFTITSFTFRFLMGLALNALFLLRGFGVAAMTHALYDVYVTIMQA